MNEMCKSINDELIPTAFFLGVGWNFDS